MTDFEERMREYRAEWESACERADYWMEQADALKKRAEAAEGLLQTANAELSEWDDKLEAAEAKLAALSKAADDLLRCTCEFGTDSEGAKSCDEYFSALDSALAAISQDPAPTVPDEAEHW